MAVDSATTLLDDPIADRSIDVLREAQAPSGAIVACPTFPTYGFSWLRDGAFCAMALDAVGERDRAAAFHEWAAAAIEAHAELAEAAIRTLAEGGTPEPNAMLPARFTIDGVLEEARDEPWPNFQLDGYGLWLWALASHADGNGASHRHGAVALAARYLAASWHLRCFNAWEEFEDGEHAATLVSVSAGLDAAARLLADDGLAREAARVRAALREHHVVDGRLRRGRTDDRVDGSLLWTAVPLGVLRLDDPLVTATAEAVRRDLRTPAGGVYRYLGDSYYGGGEWILLAASLGLHDAAAGKAGELERSRAWIRSQALPNGDLPEQVSGTAQDPDMIEPWIDRWGPVATPLTWSHAMYLLLEIAAARWNSSR
jgi:GH15 family glucan-1,4-alpha-glucosidase